MGPTPHRAVRALVLIAALASCDAATGPGSTGSRPGIEVTGGGDISDTIGFAPIQALSIRVLGSGGEPIEGTTVRFEGLMVSGPASSPQATVLVGPLDGTELDGATAVTTDSEGGAAVRIRLGYTAGSGGIVITVPTTGYQDTVLCQVRPGAPSAVEVSPLDSAAFVGGGYRLNTRVLDRAGNVRADPVEIDALGTGVSVDPSHHLSALSVGRFSIRARSGSVEDTAWISVVPRGALAMVEGTSLHVMNLDGSEGRVLSTGPSDASVDVNAPTWVPGNDALLVLRHDLGSPSRLLRIPLTGGPVLFLPDTIRPKIGALHAYHLSPDGAALFLAGSRCNIAEIVYRFDLSSSDLRRLSPPGDDCWNPIDAFPSPAPDGQHLVFVDSQDRSSPVLALLDVVSATRTSLLVPGSRAVWSPAGEWIAFSDQGAIKLVKPDGTGLRQLSQPGTAYDPSFNWSPDGMWILARAQTRWGSYPDRLELIRVSDGLRLPLVFAAGRDPDLTSRVF